MFGAIPTLIQDDPEFSESPSLVLIHDGGGTTINYYFLGDLDRHVWGISNERLVEENAWPGGIKQMAQVYSELIQSELPNGPLIFGGWSIGGLIALEMAKIFAGNTEFHILGVVMIDTFHPLARDIGISQDISAIEWGEATTEESKQVTLKSIRNCSKFAQQWGRDSLKGFGISEKLPPVILLCASEGYDISMSEDKLGWENYQHDFFSHVLNVPGNHHSLFADENVSGLTEQLSEACQILEEGF
ncbi:Alpha/Beta hydrolase protein [Annulohypoxylon maeteangense]|uniref:Alpha/Beta hydrolase protein n=1 Tax=Annulohypoxylon maeteangense TaxID=1927788 RepID=UPI002007365D|nr:Alpha/Beta hydrolase protein [Annulohypoxylon maeteangense]KAI0883626.1 Alpha/Beta hydrolase protein [Annulohypoxylon maeteangense]